jgi:hypothetical protein
LASITDSGVRSSCEASATNCWRARGLDRRGDAAPDHDRAHEHARQQERRDEQHAEDDRLLGVGDLLHGLGDHHPAVAHVLARDPHLRAVDRRRDRVGDVVQLLGQLRCRAARGHRPVRRDDPQQEGGAVRPPRIASGIRGWPVGHRSVRRQAVEGLGEALVDLVGEGARRDRDDAEGHDEVDHGHHARRRERDPDRLAANRRHVGHRHPAPSR